MNRPLTQPDSHDPARPGWPGDLWRWLTEPPAALSGPERRRARLLSSLLVVFLVLSLLALLPLILTTRSNSSLRFAIFLVILGASLLLVLAYGLNRAGYYPIAAALAVAVVALGAWAAVLANRARLDLLPVILMFVVVSLPLSSLLLSVRASALLAAAHVIGILLLPTIIPGLAASAPFTITVLLITIASAVIVVAGALRHRDLTQMERQTRQLAESEARLQAVLDNSTAIIYLKDPQGRYLLVNRQYEAMFHVARERVIGKTAADLFSSEAAADYWSADRQVLQTGQPMELEETASHPDGVHTYISVKFPLRDSAGEPYAVCSISTDITERKQAEAALRESRARYRALFEDSPISLWEEDFSAVKQRIEALRCQGVTDFRAFFEAHPEVVVEGMAAVKIVDVNNATLRLFGAGSKAELLADLSRIIPPEARPLFQNELVQIAEGRKEFEWESVNRTLAGKMIDVSLRWVAAPGYEDTLAKVFVSILDVTERKRTEEALQTANEKLILGMAELEQRTREIGMLNRMGDLLQTCLNAEEAYTVIGQSARQLFPDEAGALYMISASRDVVEAVAVWGQSPNELLECVFAPQDCWALRRGRPHLVEDNGAGLLCRHLVEPPPAAYLCIPMVAQSEAAGVLYLHHRGGHLPPAKQQLAQTVADSTALAIANLKLRETLRHQSIRDPLTGLFNRRYMEETLERETRRVARAQRPLGIIMLDVDHFKLFNDTFGHDAGDALLREFGNFLRAHVRGEDVACRYGGEEFTLILPEASRQVTTDRANHLREDVKHLHAQYHDQPLGAVTLSLGVAVFPDHGPTGEVVLKAADAALYRAKREGRDRVAVAE